jgi:hypothetical protein
VSNLRQLQVLHAQHSCALTTDTRQTKFVVCPESVVYKVRCLACCRNNKVEERRKGRAYDACSAVGWTMLLPALPHMQSNHGNRCSCEANKQKQKTAPCTNLQFYPHAVVQRDS